MHHGRFYQAALAGSNVRPVRFRYAGIISQHPICILLREQGPRWEAKGIHAHYPPETVTGTNTRVLSDPSWPYQGYRKMQAANRP